jgi:hypothetical protein
VVGYVNLLEQSERPEGRGSRRSRARPRSGTRRGAAGTKTQQASVADDDYTLRTIVDGEAAARRYGDRWLPAGSADVDAAREWMSLSPQAVLLEALAAPDLRAEASREFQGVPHRAVAWGSGERARRLLVNAETGFPTTVEELRAYPGEPLLAGLGRRRDARRVVVLGPAARRPDVPRQWDVERGGRPWKALTIAKLEPGLPAQGDPFEIPADARAISPERGRDSLDAPRLGDPNRPASELAPGVVWVPGSWGVALVRQTTASSSSRLRSPPPTPRVCSTRRRAGSRESP